MDEKARTAVISGNTRKCTWNISASRAVWPVIDKGVGAYHEFRWLRERINKCKWMTLGLPHHKVNIKCLLIALIQSPFPFPETYLPIKWSIWAYIFFGGELVNYFYPTKLLSWYHSGLSCTTSFTFLYSFLLSSNQANFLSSVFSYAALSVRVPSLPTYSIC